MMLGHVDVRTRDYVFVEPDNVDDPWVWIEDTVVEQLSLVHGSTVLYLARKKRYGWEATLIDTDLLQLVDSPSLWYPGKVGKVNTGYFFIHPDVGPPNVMCMHSSADIGYAPCVGQRMVFRAGPSEINWKYLHAIHVKTMNYDNWEWCSEHDRKCAVMPMAPPSASIQKHDLCDSETKIDE